MKYIKNILYVVCVTLICFACSDEEDDIKNRESYIPLNTLENLFNAGKQDVIQYVNNAGFEKLQQIHINDTLDYCKFIKIVNINDTLEIEIYNTQNQIQILNYAISDANKSNLISLFKKYSNSINSKYKDGQYERFGLTIDDDFDFESQSEMFSFIKKYNLSSIEMIAETYYSDKGFGCALAYMPVKESMDDYLADEGVFKLLVTYSRMLR